MKKFTKIVAFALVLVTALFMISCSSYGKIEKAFKNDGYEVLKDFEETQKTVVEQLKGKDGEAAITLHALTKVDGLKSTVVFVVEFKATDELVNFCKENQTAKDAVKSVKDNEDVQAYYDALVEAGLANGNCFVFTINPLSAGDVAKIVKNA